MIMKMMVISTDGGKAVEFGGEDTRGKFTLNRMVMMMTMTMVVEMIILGAAYSFIGGQILIRHGREDHFMCSGTIPNNSVRLCQVFHKCVFSANNLFLKTLKTLKTL